MDLCDGFLSTIAQVSATFIGFALLATIIDAGSREYPGKKYILSERFLRKWFFMLILPVLILADPLIVSLLLLKSQVPDIILLKYYDNFIIIYIIFLLYYYKKVKDWTVLMEKSSKIKIGHVIEKTPSLLLIVCLGISIGSFICKSLFGQGEILILLLIAGFLLVIRNIGISVDKGFLFSKKDINLIKLAEESSEFEYNIETAISERKIVIERINNQIKKIDVDAKSRERLSLKNELIRSRGSQKGEIRKIENLKKMIKDLYIKITGKIYKENRLCLKDFEEFEGRRVDGEKRIEEFKGGTMITKEILDSIEDALGE